MDADEDVELSRGNLPRGHSDLRHPRGTPERPSRTPAAPSRDVGTTAAQPRGTLAGRRNDPPAHPRQEDGALDGQPVRPTDEVNVAKKYQLIALE